jgi:hypothetical protein
MAISDQAAPERVSGSQQVPEHRPGFRRLGFGGFMLALGSALAAWSVLLVVLGVGALEFTFFGLQVATHPERFVINAVALSLPVAVLVVAPLAILGTAGGGGVWLGWSPRLALISCVAWMAFALALLAVGGTPGLLVFAAVLFAMLLSGAWARRRPGSKLLDLFLRGE